MTDVPRTPNSIASDELVDLRAAIGKLPKDRRSDFARLVVLILLIDMEPDDRSLTISLLSTFYFRGTRK
jgi:hypothetical protein